MKKILFLSLLLIQCAAIAQRTFYMEPCFAVSYNDKYSGPIAMPYYNGYYQVYASNYLFPGTQNYAELSKYGLFNHFNFELQTGYQYQLPSISKRKTKNDFTTFVPIAFDDELPEFAYSIRGSSDFLKETKVISDTIVNINGYNYTLKLLEYNYYLKSKTKKEYYYTAACDTIFNNTYFLHAYGFKKTRKIKKLQKLIRKIGTINYIAPSKLDDMYAQRQDEVQFRKAVQDQYLDWQEKFRANEKLRLTCSGADIIQQWTLNQLSLDQVVDYLAKFEYEALADTIEKIHYHCKENSLNQHFETLNQSKYSKEYVWNKYKLISEGKADINQFLNYMNDDSSATFIDTLEFFSRIENLDTENFETSLTNSDANFYSNYIDAKRERNVNAQFARQFAIQYLGVSPNKFCYYRKVLDQKDTKIFTFQTDTINLNYQIMAVFSKLPNGEWKHTLDQLEINEQASYTKNFVAFNNLFGLLGDENCILLDTTGNTVLVHKISTGYDLFNLYPLTLIVHNSNDIPLEERLLNYTDINFKLITDSIQIKAMQAVSHPITERVNTGFSKTPTYETYPYYPIDYYPNNKMKDEQKSKPDKIPNSILEQIKYLKPEQILYHQPYTVKDLNNDGINELYTYNVCNGKIIQQQCYTSADGNFILMESDFSKSLLENNRDVQNILFYSQLGRHQSFQK